MFRLSWCCHVAVLNSSCRGPGCSQCRAGFTGAKRARWAGGAGGREGSPHPYRHAVLPSRTLLSSSFDPETPTQADNPRVTNLVLFQVVWGEGSRCLRYDGDADAVFPSGAAPWCAAWRGFAQVSLNRLHNTNNSRSLNTESSWSA